MKITKSSIIILTALLLFVSIVNVSVTAGGRKTTFRPLEDWFVNNPPTSDWFGVSPPEGDVYYAIICVHEGGPFSVLPEGVVGETQYDGYVMERVLNDGRAMITAYLHAQNAPLSVYSYSDMIDWGISGFPPDDLPDTILGYGDDGSMEYFVWYEFILPGPVQEIPYLYSLNPDDIVAVRIQGSGYGTFTDYAADFGFTPDAEGTVQIRQLGLIEAASKADFSGPLADTWPVELIKIRECG